MLLSFNENVPNFNEFINDRLRVIELLRREEFEGILFDAWIARIKLADASVVKEIIVAQARFAHKLGRVEKLLALAKERGMLPKN